MTSVLSASLDPRLALVRDRLRELDLDALVVTSLANIFYLTNFRGSAAILLVRPADLGFVTDARYVTEVEALIGSGLAPAGMTLRGVERTYDETLAELLGGLRAGARVGFEAANLTVARYNWLRTALASSAAAEARDESVALVPTEGCVERGRERKDAHEISTLREAARRLSAVAREALPQVRAGMRERDVAALIDGGMHAAGFERPAFDTIVASGPNGGLPHARPGLRQLAHGDLVVLDFGGVYNGYCVDLTRVVSLGPPGATEQRWHAAVQEAQSAAIAAVRPGVAASSVDAAARAVLARHGLAEAFGHGTGHGLGIEIHEAPRIARRPPARATAPDRSTPEATIAAGMVFTIEPGVYFAGRGGVRIEDDVLVTDEGCEVLTDVARSLLVNQ